MQSSVEKNDRTDWHQVMHIPMQVFEDLDFTLLEMNPFTLDSAGNPFPLDMRGELDDTAAFKSAKKWGALEFPLPFGRTMTAAEEYVHSLDGNTGAQKPAFPLSQSLRNAAPQKSCLHLLCCCRNQRGTNRRTPTKATPV